MSPTPGATIHTLAEARAIVWSTKLIKNFTLKFGKAPGDNPVPITVTPVTIFVGPNNSGKSKILSEIAKYCQGGNKDASAVIFDDLQFCGLSSEKALEAIEQLKRKPNHGEAISPGKIFIGSKGNYSPVQPDEMIKLIQNPHLNTSVFCNYFFHHGTLILDGRSRIELTKQQIGGDLQRKPESSLQTLFQDDSKRREVRKIVQEAFGLYFVIDPTNLGHLRIRLSQHAPKNDLEERGVDAKAVKFHSECQLIDGASDGIKAFTGIITEVIAGNPSVLLIDEPEAFLPPPLASKLGNELSRIASTSDKKVFIATHSAAFVMGCIQSGAPVTIVRLTYQSGVATARVLPSDEISRLMRNPLLRSTGVLNGLFYDSVIVTESDSDRAFYQEINERLLKFKPEWGIKNCLFINAQNKQTIRTIIKPLRQLGIPAVGVIDIDVLKEGGAHWSSILSAANIPELNRDSFNISRKNIYTAMGSTNLEMKRDGGIKILSGSDREAAQNLLQQLGDYGIHVVPGGELESWLKELEVTGHGPKWLISIFEKMGEDPDSDSYLKPSDGDVWEFINSIKTWLVNPVRKGIPT